MQKCYFISKVLTLTPETLYLVSLLPQRLLSAFSESDEIQLKHTSLK